VPKPRFKSRPHISAKKLFVAGLRQCWLGTGARPTRSPGGRAGGRDMGSFVVSKLRRSFCRSIALRAEESSPGRGRPGETRPCFRWGFRKHSGDSEGRWSTPWPGDISASDNLATFEIPRCRGPRRRAAKDQDPAGCGPTVPADERPSPASRPASGSVLLPPDRKGRTIRRSI